jgi:hypothetical protein
MKHTCPKCKGTGYIKSTVRNGICFKCEGLGDHIKHSKRKQERERKEIENEIIFLKEQISIMYIQLNKKRILGGDARKKQLREQAQKYYTKLKGYGITLELNEIITLANTIES